MTQGIKTIIYPVKDIARAKTLYSALLGVPPIMEQPYYVGFNVNGQDIGLDPNGHAQGMTGRWPYWHVTDIRPPSKALLGAGAVAQQEVKDVGGGKLIASVKDADGNVNWPDPAELSPAFTKCTRADRACSLARCGRRVRATPITKATPFGRLKWRAQPPVR